MTAPTPTLDTLTPADAHACWQMCQALRWPHREATCCAFSNGPNGTEAPWPCGQTGA